MTRKEVYDIYRLAIRTGELVRPANCSECGTDCKPHGHHEDYEKPLEVVWLCKPCHTNRHRTWPNRAERTDQVPIPGPDRKNLLRVRVNEEEWQEAHDLAREHRVSVGVYMRQLLRAAAKAEEKR